MKLIPGQKLLCIKSLRWITDRNYITKGKYYIYLKPTDDGDIVVERDHYNNCINEVIIFHYEIPIHFRVNPTISPNIRIL